MPVSIIDQRLINLVAQHRSIGFCGEAHELRELAVCQDRAHRVPRRIEQHDGLARASGIFEGASVDREPAVAESSVDGHRTTTPDVDHRFVGIVDWVGQQHRSFGLEECAQGRMDTKRCSVGDEDLGLGVIRETLLAAECKRDRFPEAQARPDCWDSRCDRSGANGWPLPRCGVASVCPAARA